MRTRINPYILATAFTMGIVTTSGISLAASNYTQSDAEVRQEAQIWTTYALSPYLRDGNLQVSVKEGKATLTGKVSDDVNKELAGEMAFGVAGITAVDNQITVSSDPLPSTDGKSERGYGQIVDDATITAMVKSKLLWSKSSSGFSTNVDTMHGRVVLKGAAANGAAKELAGRLAKNTKGVVSVDNQLTIKSGEKIDKTGSIKKGSGDIGEAISDSWITTKVKSTFIYSSNVDSADISVATSEGVVTLSGKVGSGTERALAIELAQNIRGVKAVEYDGLDF